MKIVFFSYLNFVQFVNYRQVEGKMASSAKLKQIIVHSVSSTGKYLYLVTKNPGQ